MTSYARPGKLFTAHASLVAGSVGNLVPAAKFAAVRGLHSDPDDRRSPADNEVRAETGILKAFRPIRHNTASLRHANSATTPPFRA